MAMPYGTPDSLSEPALNGANLNIPKASQACLSCRRQKRRCDKKLPACSLCDRMSRACDYSDASPAPTAEDFNALRAKLIELEGKLSAHNIDSSSNPAYSLAGPPAHHPITHGAAPFQIAPGISSLSPSTGVAQPSPVPSYVLAPAYPIQVQNRFPPITFLDAESFQNGRIQVPSLELDIPLDVLELLGDGATVQASINEFFETVHTWLPIVSKKRLNRNMLNPMWEAGPDLALLFLCMKLTSSRPHEAMDHAQNPVYTTAKRFVALLEAGGMISLTMLQAYLLIAIYEMGHSIYPAAWMTVGSSIRYGQLLGLHDLERGPRLLPQAQTWTEMEERRRAWWAVIILDSLVAIGSISRFEPSIIPDPKMPLPGPTSCWDEGQVSSHSAITGTITTPVSESASSFARLCQASVLTGRVLRHHRSKGTPEEEQFREASALYVELSELARVLVHEASVSQDYLSLASPMAVTFSALAALCDPYACQTMRVESNTPEGATMQIQAIDGLRSVAESIRNFAQEITNLVQTSSYPPPERGDSSPHQHHPKAIDRVSPLILDALYSGASNFAWDVRESGNASSEDGLSTIRECLRLFTARWRVAGEYLRILEAQEFTYAVGHNP